MTSQCTAIRDDITPGQSPFGIDKLTEPPSRGRPKPHLGSEPVRRETGAGIRSFERSGFPPVPVQNENIVELKEVEIPVDSVGLPFAPKHAIALGVLDSTNHLNVRTC